MVAQPVTQRPKIDHERLQKHWDKVLGAILFLPPTSDFYQSYPIRPGFHFYKALAGCKQKPKSVQVDFPATVIPDEKYYTLLYTDGEGNLQSQQNAINQLYDKILAEENEKVRAKIGETVQKYSPEYRFNDSLTFSQLLEKLNCASNAELPYIVLKEETAREYDSCHLVSTYKQYKEMKGTFDSLKVEQQFVVPKTLRASAVRFMYYTKHNHSNRQNYAFILQNKSEIFDKSLKTTITRKCTLAKDIPGSFTLQKVNGASLRQPEYQCSQIVDYLEKNYPVRIQEIVLDFVPDFLGRYKMIGCRHIRLEAASTMSQYLALKQVCEDEDTKPLDQLTCSVYCQLCGMLFKKDDASKVLTQKLLYELVQHLKKRNVVLPGIPPQHSNTRQCRVCNLCYMLAVAEHHFIEVEQNFVRTLAVPLYDPVFRVPGGSQKPKSRPALL